MMMGKEHENITEIDYYYGHEQLLESLLPTNIHAGVVMKIEKELNFFLVKNMAKINSLPVVMEDK